MTRRKKEMMNKERQLTKEIVKLVKVKKINKILRRKVKKMKKKPKKMAKLKRKMTLRTKMCLI